jgi:Flp pilus assembly protein TadG
MITLSIRGRLAGDEGSTTVEMAVLTVPILLVLLVVIAGGRINSANQAIDHVATEAARAASLARTARQAQVSATSTTEQTLHDQDLHCLSTVVDVDTSGFTATLGTPATVRVNVTCTVELADIALPGLPGTKTLTSSFASPLDPFRGRT